MTTSTNNTKPWDRHIVAQVFSAALIVGLFVGVLLSTSTLQYQLWITRAFAYSATATRFGLTCSLTALAILAYRLRETRRLLYSSIELAVGVIIGWTALRDFPIEATTLPAGTFLQSASAVYVLVRGLDNLALGIRQRPTSTTGR